MGYISPSVQTRFSSLVKPKEKYEDPKEKQARADCAATCAYFEEHGHWPSREDPLFKAFLGKVNGQLIGRSKGRPFNFHQSGLTTEILQTLERKGYKPELSLRSARGIKTNPNKGKGLVGTINAELDRGVKPSVSLINAAREYHKNSCPIGHRNLEKWKKHGIHIE